MKKNPKKLQLSKETLSTLDSELAEVLGGATTTKLCTISCPRTAC